MCKELFDKLEESLKPCWNNLSIHERTSVNKTAARFELHQEACRGPNYDPGANPYEMNPKLWLRDCLVYHFKMVVVMGQRLKKFRGLAPREQALEALFSSPRG